MQFINRAKLDIVLFFQYKQFVNWPLFPQEQTVLQTPEISWPLWHGTRTGMCPTIRSSPNIRVTFSLPCRTILHLMWWHGTETMLRTSMTWRTFASSTLSPTITWWVNALSVNSALHLNTFPKHYAVKDSQIFGYGSISVLLKISNHLKYDLIPVPCCMLYFCLYNRGAQSMTLLRHSQMGPTRLILTAHDESS